MSEKSYLPNTQYGKISGSFTTYLFKHFVIIHCKMNANGAWKIYGETNAGAKYMNGRISFPQSPNLHSFGLITRNPEDGSLPYFLTNGPYAFLFRHLRSERVKGQGTDLRRFVQQIDAHYTRLWSTTIYPENPRKLPYYREWENGSKPISQFT